MMQKKRKPKQNFEISHKDIIQDTQLNAAQKIMLQLILIHHKENKHNYKHILNKEFLDILNIGEVAFNKYRDELESLNLIKIKVKILGKSVEVEKSKRKNNPLFYYPQWGKLERYNFIKSIDEKDKFKDSFIKKALPKVSKPQFKKGHIFSIEDKENILDNVLYEIYNHDLNNDGTRMFNTKNKTSFKCYGGELKRTINSLSHNKQYEYEFIQIIK